MLSSMTACIVFAATDYDPGHDMLYRVYLVAAILSAFVSVAALFVIYKQTVATAAAAKAAVEAARYSHIQAQSLINSNRPWIVYRVKKTVKPIPNSFPVEKDAYGHVFNKKQTFFEESFTNIGSTPARVIGFSVRSVTTPNGGTLPTIPNYALRGEFRQQRILDSKESWPMELQFTTKTVFLDHWKEVESGELWGWRYGEVEYLNLLDGSMHVTKFCFQYMAPTDEFIIEGPSAYTEYS